MMRSSSLLSALVATALVGGLSACAQEREAIEFLPVPRPSTAVPRASADTEPPAPLDSALVGIPVDLTCEQLLSPQAIYDYNPNVGTDPDYTPSALAQQALQYGGVACGWINQSSSVKVEVAIAQFDTSSLNSVRDAAASKTGAVSLEDVAGTLRTTAAGGVAEAFIGGYWIIIESAGITVIEDVNELLMPVAESLP